MVSEATIKSTLEANTAHYMSRFKRMGYLPDQSDIMSEIGMAITKAVKDYKGHNAAGASWSTFAAAVIRNDMKNYRERQLDRIVEISSDTGGENACILALQPLCECYGIDETRLLVRDILNVLDRMEKVVFMICY